MGNKIHNEESNNTKKEHVFFVHLPLSFINHK